MKKTVSSQFVSDDFIYAFLVQLAQTNAEYRALLNDFHAELSKLSQGSDVDVEDAECPAASLHATIAREAFIAGFLAAATHHVPFLRAVETAVLNGRDEDDALPAQHIAANPESRMLHYYMYRAGTRNGDIV